ncbi:serine hydrolase domain-containing protein [uncultured Croceitalea sp.]|uniref:serine hydrolase domain-containing protein n=1 Tax=uncultured Croceitalea sp. TaxID=1798908 RepID=UPI0033068B49
MKIFLGIEFLFLLLSGATYSQTDFPLLDKYISELSSNDKSSGHLLVSKDDTIIYSNAFGFQKDNIDENTKFIIASIAKQFTVAGLILLERKGEIDLEAPISKYISELKCFGNVKVIELINHQSGIPDLYGEEGILVQMPDNSVTSNNQFINDFATLKLKPLFAPGLKYEYSNTNYILLASILERITKEAFAPWMEKNLFKPNGLNNTGVISLNTSTIALDNSVSGMVYSNANKKITLAEKAQETAEMVRSTGNLLGQGAMFSTPSDLLKWTSLVYTGFFNDEEKQRIFGVLVDDDSSQYSFGWELENSNEFGRIAHHSGRWPGWNSNLEHQIDNNVTIVYLNNLEGKDYEYPDFYKIRQIVAGTYYDLNKTNIYKYVGNYQTEDGKNDVLVARDNELFKVYGEYELKLIPRSKTRFELQGFAPTVTYEFTFDDQDNIIESRMFQKGAGVDVKFTKRSK